jgi:hypothetical protein
MTGGPGNTPHDQPHDEQGDPICLRCNKAIVPGQPVLFVERRMRHADCRFAPQIVREVPGSTASCVVCRKPIARGVARYRRAGGEVHVECDERGTGQAESA